MNEKVKGQIERANRIFKILKEFSDMFPDEFEKCDIKKCGHCNNTGLQNKQTSLICDNCGGMGFVGFKKLYGKYVCRSCNAYGCDKCEYKGIVDWVDHVRGNDLWKESEK